MPPQASIPSPSINSFHIGPLDIHFYALMYLVGIALAIMLTRRRWRAVGGDPELVGEIALWVVPAGIIGGRIYFDITTPMDIPHVWYGPFAIWSGGLGIWGGVLVGGLVGIWRLHRHGVSPALFADAMAPGLLMAQGIGRIGNYFNKELFGRPTSLPWGLEIPYQYRVSGGIPAADLHFATFQPTFLYELIFDFAWAGALIWLGRHRQIKPPGLFALYVFGYSAYRIFEESLRIDSSVYILGLRLNMYIASVLTVVGAVWFYLSQRRPARVLVAAPPPAAEPEGSSPPAASRRRTGRTGKQLPGRPARHRMERTGQCGGPGAGPRIRAGRAGRARHPDPTWPSGLLSSQGFSRRRGSADKAASASLVTSGRASARSRSGPASVSKVSKLVSAYSICTVCSAAAPVRSGRRLTSTASPSRRRWSRAEITAPTSGSSAARARSRRMTTRSAPQNPAKAVMNPPMAASGAELVNTRARSAIPPASARSSQTASSSPLLEPNW